MCSLEVSVCITDSFDVVTKCSYGGVARPTQQSADVSSTVAVIHAAPWPGIADLASTVVSGLELLEGG
jgi:hypothetical protein